MLLAYREEEVGMYTIGLGKMELPILPENLKESVQMDNKKYDTFGAGERILPGKKKLHTWTISSYFPAHGSPSPTEFYTYYMGLITRNYTEKDTRPIDPISFRVTRELEDGTIIFSINTKVLIESIEWEDRKGEPGDLYYTIKLIEYKEFGTDVI